MMKGNFNVIHLIMSMSMCFVHLLGDSFHKISSNRTGVGGLLYSEPKLGSLDGDNADEELPFTV